MDESQLNLRLSIFSNDVVIGNGAPDVPGNELKDTNGNFMRDTDGNLMSDTETP